MPVQLGVARRRAREVGEGREHPQRLLDDRRHERRVVQHHLSLLGVLHQRAHAAAVGRLGAVVPGGHQQQEPHHDLVVLQPLAVDLGVDEHAREVVGRRRAAFGDQLAAALEHLGDLALHHALRALGRRVRVARPDDRRTSVVAHGASSSGGMPMKLPITRATTGCATSLTRSHSSRPSSRSRTPS